MLSRIIKLTVAAALVVLMASCSETDGTDTAAEKYTNWTARNASAFKDSLALARQKVDAGDSTYHVFRSWSLDHLTPSGLTASSALTFDDEDYIVAHELHDGGSNFGSPMSTDSVRVHYAGFLINGDCFDSSWQATNSQSVPDYTTARPVTFIPTSVVDGFATALLHMHNGDEWLVTMPAKLAYKDANTGTYGATNYIPANSTLIFRIKLDSYYRK